MLSSEEKNMGERPAKLFTSEGRFIMEKLRDSEIWPQKQCKQKTKMRDTD